MNVTQALNDKLVKNCLYGENDCELQFVDDIIIAKKRKASYDSPAVKVDELLGQHDAYSFSALIKADSDNDVSIVATFKLTVEYLNLKYTTYHFGMQKSANNKNWNKVSCKLEIPVGSKLVSLIAYFVQRGSFDNLPDIMVKDFIIEKAEATSTIVEKKDKKPIKRQKNATVGAIRWDAYNTTGTNDSFVSDQVARALSEYPENAPYFSIYKDNNIHFNKATQEQFDFEAQLASDAGIDYFAYCWYKNSSAMAYARQQHLLSPYKDKIKMCAIIGVSAMDDETYSSLAQAMTDDCYLKFDNRPVVYLYDAFNFSMDAIKKLEDAMKEKNIVEMPYYIGMAHKVSPFIINSFTNKGIDAMGAYACLQRETVEPYKNHSANVFSENDEKYQYYEHLDVVPLISCGRDSRPRIKNPVSWAGNYEGKYIVQPTFDELYNHVSEVLIKMQDEEKNIPNTALIYAWNEHDEGAWCCPTLTIKDGAPLYNNDGSPVMNTTFLDALKKAIKDNKK